MDLECPECKNRLTVRLGRPRTATARSMDSSLVSTLAPCTACRSIQEPSSDVFPSMTVSQWKLIRQVNGSATKLLPSLANLLDRVRVVGRIMKVVRVGDLAYAVKFVLKELHGDFQRGAVIWLWRGRGWQVLLPQRRGGCSVGNPV